MVILMISCFRLTAQELYVFSEPASNMPANSIAAKIGFRSPVSQYNNYFRQRYMPEIMFGINKNLMIHASNTFSDFYSPSVRWESAKIYAKYRFFSSDDIHRHFRMAAFAEGAYTRNPFLYGEINLDGDNSGIQGGLIATQLVNKLAISTTVSLVKVLSKKGSHMEHETHSREALQYSLSAGYLLFPFHYTDYKQTNVNLYVEMLGMQGLKRNHYMLDLAPAVQLIFNSNFKINAGYRVQLTGNMLRVGEKNWVIGVERTFLGAFRKKRQQQVTGLL
jgi:hypothetical protein